MVILGRPPVGLCLMSKAGHWRPYHDGLLMKAQCCHHGNSSHFFIFFMEQEARTYTNSKTRYELRKKLTLGYSHTSPTLGVCKTSSVWSSSLLLQLFLHQGISRGCSWCSQHVRRCCLSVILLDLPLERLATKNTRRKNTSQNMLLLLLKGNKYDNPGYLLAVLCFSGYKLDHETPCSHHW